MYDFQDDEDGLTQQERRDDQTFNDILTACALAIIAVALVIPVYLYYAWGP